MEGDVLKSIRSISAWKKWYAKISNWIIVECIDVACNGSKNPEDNPIDNIFYSKIYLSFQHQILYF